MKAHLFLDSGVLKVTTEAIPYKCSQNLAECGLTDFDAIGEEWHCKCEDAMASIKQRATVVGNGTVFSNNIRIDNSDGTIMKRIITGRSDLQLNHTHDEEGKFYQIDCEVRYDWQWHPIGRSDWRSTNEYYIIQCQLNGVPTRKVAILSPVVAQECKGQFRNDCSYPQCECVNREING